MTVALFAAGSLAACNKQEASASPDDADVQADEAQPMGDEDEADPAVASPTLIATYQGLANEIYGRDAERCLEDEMETESSRYMRANYTLTVTIDTEGLVTDVQGGEVSVQVRNYEGDLVREGNAESMGACVAEAAKEWEFEPLPPSVTTFPVSGSLGD